MDEEDHVQSAIQKSLLPQPKRMTVFVQVNNDVTKTIRVTSEDFIEEQLIEQLRIPQELLNNASLLRGNQPLDPRTTFGEYEFKGDEVLQVKSQQKGGGRNHNRKHKYKPNSKYWYQRSLRVQTDLSIKDI
jgi:hypothetical protein